MKRVIIGTAVFCSMVLFITGAIIYVKQGTIETTNTKSSTAEANVNKNNQVVQNSPSENPDEDNKQGSSTIQTDSAEKEKEDALEKEYQVGYDLFAARKYKDAVNAESKLIQKEPGFYKAYDIKGIALCFSGNFQEGMKNIDKCLELKSDYGHGRYDKALAYELFHYYDKAIEWYQKSLEVENLVWSYYGIASIYGRYGDVQNSVKYLQQAINLNPDVREEARKEKDFNNVRNSKEFTALVGR